MSEDGASQAAEQAAATEQKKQAGRELVEQAEAGLQQAETALNGGNPGLSLGLLEALQSDMMSRAKNAIVPADMLQRFNTAKQKFTEITTEATKRIAGSRTLANPDTVSSESQQRADATDSAETAPPDEEQVQQVVAESESTESLVESVAVDSLQVGEIVHIATAGGDRLQLHVTGSNTDPDTGITVPIFRITTVRPDGSSTVEENIKLRENVSEISDGARLRYMSADPEKPGYTATPEITGITVSDSERVPQIIVDTAREASSARTQVAAEGASAQEETVAEDSITGGSMQSETSEQSRIPASEDGEVEVSSAEAGENSAAIEPEVQQTASAAPEQQAPAAQKEKKSVFSWLNPFRRKAQPNLTELSEAVTAAATPSVAETADVPRTPLQRTEREAAPTPETTQAAAEAAPEATTPPATEPIPAAAPTPDVTPVERTATPPVEQPQQENAAAETQVEIEAETTPTVEAEEQQMTVEQLIARAGELTPIVEAMAVDQLVGLTDEQITVVGELAGVNSQLLAEMSAAQEAGDDTLFGQVLDAMGKGRTAVAAAQKDYLEYLRTEQDDSYQQKFDKLAAFMQVVNPSMENDDRLMQLVDAKAKEVLGEPPAALDRAKARKEWKAKKRTLRKEKRNLQRSEIATKRKENIKAAADRALDLAAQGVAAVENLPQGVVDAASGVAERAQNLADTLVVEPFIKGAKTVGEVGAVVEEITIVLPAALQELATGLHEMSYNIRQQAEQAVASVAQKGIEAAKSAIKRQLDAMRAQRTETVQMRERTLAESKQFVDQARQEAVIKKQQATTAQSWINRLRNW